MFDVRLFPQDEILTSTVHITNPNPDAKTYIVAENIFGVILIDEIPDVDDKILTFYLL
jgi:hypothetical protein